MVEAKIFGAPTGGKLEFEVTYWPYAEKNIVIAPALADFWQANLKAHLDAKGGGIAIQG